MGRGGGADSQNKKEVDSHTDVLIRQEQIPASAVGASEKGLPNIHGNNFQSEYKPNFRDTSPHICHTKTQGKKIAK